MKCRLRCRLLAVLRCEPVRMRMQRHTNSLYLGMALAAGLAAPAAAQSTAVRQPVTRLVSAAESRPADRVHIAPTAMAANSASLEKGSDRWSARGYDLKSLIAEIYDLDARQVDLAESN